MHATSKERNGAVCPTYVSIDIWKVKYRIVKNFDEFGE